MFTSCSEDDLKLNSPNDYSDANFYKTASDFETAIRGVYDGYRSIGFYGGSASARDMIIVGDLLTDNVVYNPFGRGSNRNGYNFNFTGNTTPTDIYENGYKIIARANKVLAQINNLEDVKVKNKIKSEALALRALAHFDIAKAYAQIPTQSANAGSTLGIAYVTEFDGMSYPTRVEKIEEVYNLIITDLETALAGLPTATYNGASPYSDTYYRLNQTSLKGLLAKVYLYKGDYAKVIEYAQPVVDAVAPTNKENLDKFWKTETNEGALFVLPFFQPNDNEIGTNYSQGTDPNSYRFEYTVDKAFYDLFDANTDSYRLNASIFETTQSVSSEQVYTVYAVKKYMNSRPGYNAGINDGRYLRVEDVILMLAEAQYLSGNQGAALNTLDKLRDARYSSYTGGEQGEDLFDAIMLERRKELAFEGDRWYTIKRLLGVSGISGKYAQGIVRSGNGFQANGEGAAPTVMTVAPGSHLWQFPISQSTVNLEKNIGQTPGY